MDLRTPSIALLLHTRSPELRRSPRGYRRESAAARKAGREAGRRGERARRESGGKAAWGKSKVPLGRGIDAAVLVVPSAGRDHGVVVGGPVDADSSPHEQAVVGVFAQHHVVQERVVVSARLLRGQEVLGVVGQPHHVSRVRAHALDGVDQLLVEVQLADYGCPGG